MAKQTTIASSCLLFLYITTFTVVEFVEAEASHHHHHHHHHHRHGSVKLFVFGDSYVDTGNTGKSAGAWKEPYGITFPGNPAGRFSDGRVLTDYLASFLGIRPPVPYELRKFVNKTTLEYGMNFAYGGTGVFETLVSGPNLTTQIDFFQQLVEQKVYTTTDIDSSIALVSVAGNDYAAHFGKPGNQTQDMAAVTKSIINQLSADLKRINRLGLQKIAVTALEPMGCVPRLTSFLSYENCSETANLASVFHNQMLQQKLEELKRETNSSGFVILDLYNSFLSAVQPQQLRQGNATFQINPLTPCCVGVSSEYFCGSVDERGAKKYTICDSPKLSFFWDMVHPSDNGWHAVFPAIKSSMQQLY